VNAWTCDASASLDYVIASVAGVDGPSLARELEDLLGLRGVEVPPMAAYRGYSGAAALCAGAERQVTVQWAIGRDPLVVAPGNISGKVAAYLQRYEHQCSRKDAAVDFTDPDAFEVVAKVAMSMAIEKVIKTSSVGDWLTPGAPDGRTLYIYSRKSNIFIRIYEHSKLHADSGVSCRIEVEVKPDKKAGKMQLASLDVGGVLGISTFMIELLEKFGHDYERIPLAGYVRQLSDLEQRLIRCHMQYGRTFDELLQMVNGDLSAFTERLWAVRDVLERRRAQSALAAARPKAVPLLCL
jgi:DNA relaxase NicK